MAKVFFIFQFYWLLEYTKCSWIIILYARLSNRNSAEINIYKTEDGTIVEETSIMFIKIYFKVLPYSPIENISPQKI